MKAQYETVYRYTHLDKDGNLIDEGEFCNLVVNEGLDDTLDKYFKGSSYTAAHYIGLKSVGAVLAADTMASQANWSEVTDYTQSARPTFVAGTVANQQVDNSASVATFTFNADAVIAGAFAATDSTKGGTSGVLYGAGDFPSARNVTSGDTLNITVTFQNTAA